MYPANRPVANVKPSVHAVAGLRRKSATMKVHNKLGQPSYDQWPDSNAATVPGTLDHEYNTRAWAHNYQETLSRHCSTGEAVRQSPGALLAIPWGARPRQRLDLLLPHAQRGPLVLYLHGGFWQFRSSGKEGGAFLAPEFLKRGIAYAGVSYELCPDVRMEQMVMQICEAVAWLVNRAPGFGYDIERLTLVGHSAGAHLAAMAALADWRLLGMRHDLIAGVCGVSGIYDLRPLLATQLNRALRMSARDAERCSPILNLSRRAPRMLLSYGAYESGELKRQTRDFYSACSADGIEASMYELSERDHYATIEDLAVPGHPMFVATMEMALGTRESR